MGSGVTLPVFSHHPPTQKAGKSRAKSGRGTGLVRERDNERQSLRTRGKSDGGVSSYLKLFLKQGRINTNRDSTQDKSPAPQTARYDS